MTRAEHYWSYEEQEAYKDGKRDEERHNSDYQHDKFAYDGPDRAYWDGRKDQEAETRQREEEERERQEEEERELNQERERQEEREYQEYLEN